MVDILTTKKQILQWSPEGEVEVNNKGTKQHLGELSELNILQLAPILAPKNTNPCK